MARQRSAIFGLAIAAIILALTVSCPALARTLNVNTASEADLAAVNGIGKKVAAKIVVANRPYGSASDPSTAGVFQKKIDKIGPMLSFESSGGAPEGGGSPAATEHPSKRRHRKSSEGAASEAPATEASPEAVGSPTAGEHASKRRHRKSSEGAASEPPAAEASPEAVGSPAAAEHASKRRHRKSSEGAASEAPAAETPPEAVASPAAAEHASKRQHRESSEAAASEAPAATPPSPGMVWANADSKVYHTAGDRWYGKTKKGQWMTEQDAIKAGYRKSKQD